jgi:hypothetical protein
MDEQIEAVTAALRETTANLDGHITRRANEIQGPVEREDLPPLVAAAGDVEELLAERGSNVDHVTVHRWVYAERHCCGPAERRR